MMGLSDIFLYSILSHNQSKPLLRGLPSCIGLHLVVTLLVRAECVRQRNEVAIKLGIISISLSLSRRLLKTIEGGVVGF